MITKLVHCFYEMKLIALAAITGQLLRNVKVHLLYISPILKQTPQASDGGKLYFPYIFNIPIFEAMSDSYERFEMYSYHLQLVSLIKMYSKFFLILSDQILSNQSFQSRKQCRCAQRGND